MNQESKILEDAVGLRDVSLPEDEGFLKRLVFELYSDYQEAWSLLDETQKSALLEIQYSAQRAEYARLFPNSENFVILKDNKLAGRLLIDRSEQVLHVIDITVCRDYRNLGIGSLVLAQLMEECAFSLRKLSLSVAKSIQP